MNKLLLALVFGATGLIPGRTLSAQAKASLPASFEVASIRQDNAASNRHMVVRIVNRPNDGKFYATAVTAKMLIQDAYGVRGSQIEGGPSWINTERFDVQAETDDSMRVELKNLSPAQGKLVKRHMLQTLMAGRFKLTVLHKTKELPVYNLVVTKNGPKLHDASRQANLASAGGPNASRGTMAGFQPGKGERYITFYNGSMTSIAEALSHLVGRMVTDKTGLTGRYNFTLWWTPEMPRGGMAGGPGLEGPEHDGAAGGNGPAGMGPASDVSGPSLFTALQEQLGLRLKPAKGPVEVLVIDHIEPPTPN